ncbi:MAG: MarR family transcriptional regulator [Oscillospiraceae bacterium]|nr:MarR family transcriptional regulator [Oscillospiraceae bacterium]
MLYQEIKTLYEKLRLKHYHELFSRVKERDGSLSATEAYAADVIYLLKNPTVSTFADTLGISQPNATYKINNLVSKGYAMRTTSEEDRRECRVTVGDRFYSYYNTDYPFIANGVEELKQSYTPEELELFERILNDLNKVL